MHPAGWTCVSLNLHSFTEKGFFTIRRSGRFWGGVWSDHRTGIDTPKRFLVGWHEGAKLQRTFCLSECVPYPWWRHQMETFSALLAICAGNSPVPGEFPAQRPVTRSFDVFFDLHPNKRLSKQLWSWWFETQSCPLWRHRNAFLYTVVYSSWGVQWQPNWVIWSAG